MLSILFKSIFLWYFFVIYSIKSVFYIMLLYIILGELGV